MMTYFPFKFLDILETKHIFAHTLVTKTAVHVINIIMFNTFNWKSERYQK